MMLATPEFVVAESVQMLGEVEIATELQRGVLADGMVGREECPEFDSGHGSSPWEQVNVPIQGCLNNRNAL